MSNLPNQLWREPQGGKRAVTTLITGARLQDALGPNGFIKNGVPSSVEGAKYDFRMSPLILKSSFGGAPVDLALLTEEQRAKISVEPGEVVFVRTTEVLNLPADIAAVLSMKRKLSHQGIIALGGFCIDPLYKGPLFVGLYNFSSTPFPLQAGKKLIAALFYRLEGEELTKFPVPEPMSEDDFPDELKTLIRNYKPVELKGLTEALNNLQAQFNSLQDEVRDDRTWKKDFREALSEQSTQIKQLLQGLQEEKAARKDEDSALRTKLEGMSNVFTSVKLIWVIVWTATVLLFGGLIGPYVTKLFNSTPAVITTPQSTSSAPLGKTSP